MSWKYFSNKKQKVESSIKYLPSFKIKERRGGSKEWVRGEKREEMEETTKIEIEVQKEEKLVYSFVCALISFLDLKLIYVA